MADILPAGRHLTLTWSIPDDFGGMTSALLHRSRSFVRLGGTTVDVVTFDARPDYPQVEQQLRDRGELIEGMRLLNIWDWFRDNPLPADAPGKLELKKHPFTPLGTDPSFVSTARDGRELSRARVSGDTVLQVDYYREDGTLLASDVRDLPGALKPGRSVILCDTKGEPLRSWGSVWGLYRYWLDLLRAGEPAYLIVDSKPVALFAATYRRKGVVVAHVVHSSHLEEDGVTFKPSRAPVFQNLGAYDSVVILTDRQKADIERLLGRSKNLVVIGNGRTLPQVTADTARPVERGIMLASLQDRKRVDHAVRAIATVRAAHPDVTLDVYGDGPERAHVAAVITELDAPVQLRGHVPNARDLLPSASFLLLTSTAEGLPLVLVEAMAVGCIPIAYDIPYGPADVIRDGENGFLVPAGDPAGVAAAIERLFALSPRQVEKMRRNAIRFAQRYSDAEIVRLWGREFAAANKRARKLFAR